MLHIPPGRPQLPWRTTHFPGRDWVPEILGQVARFPFSGIPACFVSTNAYENQNIPRLSPQLLSSPANGPVRIQLGFSSQNRSRSIAKQIS